MPTRQDASRLQERVRLQLRSRVSVPVDDRGHVGSPEENLIPGVELAHFRGDLGRAAGGELLSKFRTVHSSSAAAVNTFAWFKPTDRLLTLPLLGQQGALNLRFERSLPVFRGGTPPHIDVWVERKGDIVAVESKLTEHLARKRPVFSSAYDRLAPPAVAEPRWWEVYREARAVMPQYLDVAQLVKHYFGLRKYQTRTKVRVPLSLLYLFWEPTNWKDTEVCTGHRTQVEELARRVSDSTISFHWLTYGMLWTEWEQSGDSSISAHVKELRSRYEVAVD